MRQAGFVLVTLLPFGGVSAQNIWADQIPSHQVACSESSISTSDASAVSQATASLTAALSQANLIPGPAEPIISPVNAPMAILCLQLAANAKPAGQGKGFRLQTVASRPAILALCGGKPLEPCRSELKVVLGANWSGSLYVVPVFSWVDPSGNRVGQAPTHEALVKTAASLDASPTEPDPKSVYKQTDLLLVAPAPDGTTVSDLLDKISPPTNVQPAPAT
jgi:hypothetical protein